MFFAQEPDSDIDSEEEEEEEEEGEEVCSTERTGADQRYDEDIDKAAEEEGLQRYREARANVMFPDEVDTPLDMPAKIRSVLINRFDEKCAAEKSFLRVLAVLGLRGQRARTSGGKLELRRYSFCVDWSQLKMDGCMSV